MQSNARKQSIYYDMNQSDIKKVELGENNDNFSDNEDNTQPFRLRSGTDISDSLNNSRYKFRKSHCKTTTINAESINSENAKNETVSVDDTP
jgi:hypothetical protein